MWRRRERQRLRRGEEEGKGDGRKKKRKKRKMINFLKDKTIQIWILDFETHQLLV